MSRETPDFWSRRRAAVAAEAEADAAAESAEALRQEREVLEEKSDEEVLEALGLADPDTLERGDDFSAFLRAEVPDRLRRRALRRLWRSNPVLANLDTLVEYGEDYTDAATVIENLQTTYRVGKGMLDHILELEKAKDAPEPQIAEAEGEAPLSLARAEGEAPPQTAEAEGEAPLSDPKPAEAEGEAPPEDQEMPRPRRMRFQYGQETV